MNYKKQNSLIRWRSFQYASEGLLDLFKHQANARLHLAISVLVLIAAIVFDLSALEWIALILLIGMVFMAELFNTAIEYLADQVSTEYSVLIKRSKDVAAAAVLMAAIVAVVVGGIIFIPKIPIPIY